MDKKTKLEKTLGSIAYNYVGTALRAQLWMLCGLSNAFSAYIGGYKLSSIGLIYIFVMLITFGHFFSYLPTNLRKYGFSVKGHPRLWWLIFERTFFPLFFLIYLDIIKMRFQQRYNIGQQWFVQGPQLYVLKEIERAEQAIELKTVLATKEERKRLEKLINWAQGRKKKMYMQMFTDISRAIGQHIENIEDHFRWDTDEDKLAGLFHRYQFGIPYHKKRIELHYNNKMTPSDYEKNLPEISPKQTYLEGKILYLAVLIRAAKDNHYDQLDLKKTDFNAGRYVYTSNRSAIDIAYWSKNLPAINAYLGGEWVVEPLDGTSLVLFQLAELPSLIPFKTEFLKQDQIFYGFNVRTGEPYYTSLEVMPHTLVVGKSGSGKSVFLNQVMASLLFNITHFEKIYLIDLKGGVELGKYKGLHSKIHLVDHYDGLLELFQQIFTQMEDRLKQMRQNGLTHFDGPHLYIICDEFAQIGQYPAITKEERENKLKLISYLNRISMLGRAAKVSLNVMLQKALKENIEPSFKNNMATKICFKVHSNSDAALVFGNTEDLPAIGSIGGFKALPKGRFLMSDDINGEDTYMQSTFIAADFPLARLLQTAGNARVVSEAQVDE